MGTFINRASNSGVDPRLLAWIQAAAANSPYNVALQSGLREGDPRYHGRGMAIDVQLIDPATGKVVPNYQDPQNFATYQQFANSVRAAQMAADPAAQLRWGGYFSGPKGRYGALDLMHFDTGNTAMGGGGWDTGLTAEQAALWGLQPGGGYTGTPAGPVPPSSTAATLAAAAQPFDSLTSGLGGLGSRAGERLRGGQGEAVMGVPPPQPIAPLQLESATPELAPPQPVQMSPLAELFKVKPIGGAAQPALPARRF